MTPDESLHESLTSVGDSALRHPPQPRKAILTRSFLALLSIAAFVGLLLGGVIACPIKLASGVPCPGCGLTRATMAMLQLDLETMLSFHPLAPLLSPLVFWVIGSSTFRYIRGGAFSDRDPLSRIPNSIWVVLLIAFLGLWVSRLLGAFGGHPDGFHPEQGVLFRILSYVFG